MDLYEDFEGTSTPDVNEANSTFTEDLDDVAFNMNVLHYLSDEGYLNDNGSLKADATDAADAIEKEMEMSMKEVWDSEPAFDAWLQGVMDDLREFGSKY